MTFTTLQFSLDGIPNEIGAVLALVQDGFDPLERAVAKES